MQIKNTTDSVAAVVISGRRQGQLKCRLVSAASFHPL